MHVIDLAEMSLLPDWLIRIGIRRLLARRVAEQGRLTQSDREREKADFIAEIRRSPLATATREANEQHYEVPAEFFRLVLGPRLKYSCCWFDSSQTDLAESEVAMLRLTCERAALADGQRVLELGCGWGSLSLWMAEQYPASEITAVSNSHSQREYIEATARARGIENLRVITVDMRDLTLDEEFDRIVSVEMFEHMRNYELLLARVSQWLAPEGKLFVHIFCHRDGPYLFETTGAVNWMGRHFFTGGMMPSADLLSHFDQHLEVAQAWCVSGTHYYRTCEAWLRNLDLHRREVLDVFRAQMTMREARLAVQRWRMFFMACAELFRYRTGEEWFVGHYLLQPSRRAVSIDQRILGVADLSSSPAAPVRVSQRNSCTSM